MRTQEIVRWLIVIIAVSVLSGLLLSAICGFSAGGTIACIFFIAAAILFGFVWCVTLKDDAAERRACDKVLTILHAQRERPYSVIAQSVNRKLNETADELRRQMRV